MNNNNNNNRTPAGFNTEKMVADAVASLIYNAQDNLSTAISLLIETYELNNEVAEKIQKNLQISKKSLQEIWEYTNKELRHIKD